MTILTPEQALPRSDSNEAHEAIAVMFRERNYPCAPSAAARCGFEAAYRLLALAATAPDKVAPAVPESNQYLTDDDMVSLQRFDECCEDSDSGGHDVSKNHMARLYEIGAVRSIGFGRSEMTSFGRYVLEHFFEQKSSLPLMTYRDYELAAAKQEPK